MVQILFNVCVLNNGGNFVVCLMVEILLCVLIYICICPWRGDVLPMGPLNNGGNFVAD